MEVVRDQNDSMRIRLTKDDPCERPQAIGKCVDEIDCQIQVPQRDSGHNDRNGERRERKTISIKEQNKGVIICQDEMSCVAIWYAQGGGEHRPGGYSGSAERNRRYDSQIFGGGAIMDMSQYLEIFIEENKEHLQSLNQSLLQLEKNPGDRPTLNEIFRVAHTIKGMAGTMGFNKMSKLTHDMENVLHALRNDEIEITADLVDILFKCLDALEGYTANIVETGNEGSQDSKELSDILSGLLANKKADGAKAPEQAKAVAPPMRKEIPGSPAILYWISINQYHHKAADLGNNAYQITVRLNKGCLLKSARAFNIQDPERHSE